MIFGTPPILRWLVASLLLLALPAMAEQWRVAFIGDTPYSEYEEAQFPAMLTQIGQHHVQLIAHIGDIKHSRVRCTDELFAARFSLFDQSPTPFVFSPGDNEWTDCDRKIAGGYDPLERLAALRRLFWASPFSLGQQRIPLKQQSSAFPEHSQFALGPVLFLSLNVPGGNNNYGPQETPSTEFQVRHPQVLAWLKAGFQEARRAQHRGIVILFQANPGFSHFNQGLGHRGYRELLEVIRTETEQFSGEVLLVHGDTHIHRIDKPLRDARGKTLPNFTRLETYGYPVMGWSKVIIDDQANTLFRFESHPWPQTGLPRL